MKYKTISEALSEAFDEGAQSPYEFKEDTINAISKKIKTGKLNTGLLTAEAIPRLKNNIHSYVLNILKRYPNEIALAGGSIARCLLRIDSNFKHAWRTSDYDIYVNENIFNSLKEDLKSHHTSFRKALSSSNEYKDISIKNVWVAKHAACKRRIQFIEGNYNSIADMVANYDITICQFAFYYNQNKEWALYAAPNVWQDFMDGVIRLNNLYKKGIHKGTSINGTKKRIIKYIYRGFRDTTGLVEKGSFFSNYWNRKEKYYGGEDKKEKNTIRHKAIYKLV